MKGAHAYFAGSGNVRLHYRCWDVPAPRAVVVVSHGLGEHSGRYDELAKDFARAAVSTYALDHRGHGRSDGRKGHVRRFVHYVQDLEKFRRCAVGGVGRDVPLFFLGHSMGGLILIRYLQEYPGVPTYGAVLSAPLLGVKLQVPRWKQRISQFLLYAAPALPLSTGLDPAVLSHDAQVVASYRRDPLVHDRITPRLYAEMHHAIGAAHEKAQRIRAPVLVLIPSEDKIVRADRAQGFARSLQRSESVQVKTYPGLYHEVLNETTRSSTVADMLGWIEQRIAQPAKALS